MDQPREHEHDDGPASASGGEDEALRRDLQARFGGQPFVPGRVDELVLAQADAHFAAMRRQRIGRRWRLAVASAGVAAAIALGVWLADPFGEAPSQQVAHVQPALPGDVNGDGVVDVLDMLALARKLEAGVEPPPHADVTGDGRVTLADVEAIGQRIVRLSPGGAREEGAS